MPEGDTIHRTADRLGQALRDKEVRRFEAPRLRGRAPGVGTTVVSVEARGKHLLIGFDDGLTLRTHMGMTGSWHLYEPGQRWRKPRHLARVVLEVDDLVAVCFAAPTVEMVAPRDVVLSRLGPDLCRADVDLDSAVARMDALVEPGAEIADVLLDQRVASGVGNVFKSETLFACGLDPFTPVSRLDTDAKRRVLETASRLLRASTRPNAVYGRARRPCRRCGTPILSRRQGGPGRPARQQSGPERTTYWCPTCQR